MSGLRLAVRFMLLAAVAMLGGCGSAGRDKATLMLDWVPNTNHTGIYVALDKGWYRQQGIDLQVIQPAQTGVEQVVGAGQAQFGISFSEWTTSARAQGVPIVSIAAIIQHNTSGFASPASKGLKRPKDLEGRRYGGGGLDVERAMLQALMACDGGDVSKVQFVNTGGADFFTVTQRDVDFAWIYYAWDGIGAELRGVPINVIWLRDYERCVPDYYTPIIITGEKTIAEKPDLVRRFMAATAQGYQFAIGHPDEAADILIKHAEADPNLIRRSQAWLSPRYAEGILQWGYQDPSVWERFTKWMADNKLIPQPIAASTAFTNDFLPRQH